MRPLFCYLEDEGAFEVLACYVIDSMIRVQTSIEAEGFRSLREGEDVEFDVEESPDGRTKAVKVTGPEGAAPQVMSWKAPRHRV